MRRLKNIFFVTLFFVFVIISVEFALRSFFGLGNPVIYDASLIYGYRPLPNQNLKRFYGTQIKINNLGLRAENNWGKEKDGKILFLGDSITYGGSYINNADLFSEIAVRKLKEYCVGNAGVNAWGVENVYGLVVKKGFIPAQIYVSVFPEFDFYRGLVQAQGLPIFNRKPRSAIEEVLLFYCYKINLKRYIGWDSFASREDVENVVENAVVKLKEMDNFIKANGMKHFIFIIPTRAQLFYSQGKDPLLAKLLEKHKIEVTYLVDKLKNYGLLNERTFFQDDVHLKKEGHKIIGDVIGEVLCAKLTDE